MGGWNYDDWRKNGACSNSPELNSIFFSSDSDDIALAKSICRGCNVKTDCLLEAIRFRCEGIFAGLTEDERKMFRAFMPSKQSEWRDWLDSRFQKYESETRTQNQDTSHKPKLVLSLYSSNAQPVKVQKVRLVLRIQIPVTLKRTG